MINKLRQSTTKDHEKKKFAGTKKFLFKIRVHSISGLMPNQAVCVQWKSQKWQSSTSYLTTSPDADTVTFGENGFGESLRQNVALTVQRRGVYESKMSTIAIIEKDKGVIAESRMPLETLAEKAPFFQTYDISMRVDEVGLKVTVFSIPLYTGSPEEVDIFYDSVMTATESMLDGARVALGKLKEEKEISEREAAEAVSRSDELTKETTAQTEQLQELRDSIAKKEEDWEAERKNLMASLDEVRAAYASYRKESEQNEEKMKEQLQQKIHDLEEKNKASWQQCVEKNDEIELLRSEVMELGQQQTRAKSALERARSTIEEMRSRNSLLREELESGRSVIDASRVQLLDIQKENRELKMYETLYKTLEISLGQERDAVAAKSQEADVLRREIDAARAVKEKREEELLAELQLARDRETALTMQLSQMEKELDEMQTAYLTRELTNATTDATTAAADNFAAFEHDRIHRSDGSLSEIKADSTSTPSGWLSRLSRPSALFSKRDDSQEGFATPSGPFVAAGCVSVRVRGWAGQRLWKPKYVAVDNTYLWLSQAENDPPELRVRLRRGERGMFTVEEIPESVTGRAYCLQLSPIPDLNDGSVEGEEIVLALSSEREFATWKIGLLQVSNPNLVFGLSWEAMLTRDERILSPPSGQDPQTTPRDINEDDVGGIDESMMNSHTTWTRNGVPVLILAAIQIIERRGIELEGLYRISAEKHDLEAMIERLNTEGITISSKLFATCPNMHVVAGLLKRFLRDAPPLLTFDLYEDFLACARAEEKKRLSLYADVIGRLPRSHKPILRRLLQHFCRVSDRASVNKMTPKNLAIVIAPNVLRPREDRITQTVMDAPHVPGVVEFMISNFATLKSLKCFDE
eukprot:Rmarinus@m.14855